MEIHGNPAGTIYLNHGQITFAQASWIPDLSARLLGALRLSAASRELIAGPDRPDRDIGTVLVQRNYLSRGDLQAILRSVVVDAALVLMLPVDRDAFVSDIRFAAAGAPGANQHWAGAFSSLCVDFVLIEVIKKAERMARFNVARTTPIRLRDLGASSAVLSREQWAVACAIDGARSAQDLAWTCGLALYDAIECVGRLIQAGVCVPEPHRAAPPGAAEALKMGTVSPFSTDTARTNDMAARPGASPGSSGRGPATDSSRRASSLYASTVVPNTLRLRSQARSRGVEPCLTRISKAHCKADTRIASGRICGLRANAVSAVSTTDSCPSTRWRLATSASSASSDMSDAGPVSGTLDGLNLA